MLPVVDEDNEEEEEGDEEEEDDAGAVLLEPLALVSAAPPPSLSDDEEDEDEEDDRIPGSKVSKGCGLRAEKRHSLPSPPPVTNRLRLNGLHATLRTALE